MLVQLDIQNYRSFKKKVTFNTFLGNYKRFSNHVYKYNENVSILKTSGIYGPNGSGKTNIFKALYHLKKIIEIPGYLRFAETIKNFSNFRLSKENSLEPIIIRTAFIEDDILFDFYIEIDHNKRTIIKETLESVFPQRKTCYVRENNNIEFNEDSSLFKIAKEISAVIPEYQPLLGFELIKDPEIAKARNWFTNGIEFLFPDYEFEDIAYLFASEPHYIILANDIISKLNLGIEKIEVLKYDINVYFGLEKEDQIREISDILNTRNHHSFKDYAGNYCTAIRDPNNNIEIIKLVCTHLDDNNLPVHFDLDQESKGTIVILHLLPALLRSYGEGINYFIDDINTSLHPMLLKEIIEQYVTNNLANAKGQLIFNSHETILMDEKIVRQDEIWLVEKVNGISDIFPITDFDNVRFDLNLKKNYANGRFGGVPFTKKPDRLNFG